MLNIQIFGKAKSHDTRRAQMFFKERGIRVQQVDLLEKGLSPREFESVAAAVGGWEKLVDENSRDKEALGLLQWLAPSQQQDKLMETPALFKTPIVRNGRQATVGYCPDVWKQWLEAEGKGTGKR